jgi:hypothetical protein
MRPGSHLLRLIKTFCFTTTNFPQRNANPLWLSQTMKIASLVLRAQVIHSVYSSLRIADSKLCPHLRLQSPQSILLPVHEFSELGERRRTESASAMEITNLIHLFTKRA